MIIIAMTVNCILYTIIITNTNIKLVDCITVIA